MKLETENFKALSNFGPSFFTDPSLCHVRVQLILYVVIPVAIVACREVCRRSGDSHRSAEPLANSPTHNGPHHHQAPKPAALPRDGIFSIPKSKPPLKLPSSIASSLRRHATSHEYLNCQPNPPRPASIVKPKPARYLLLCQPSRFLEMQSIARLARPALVRSMHRQCTRFVHIHYHLKSKR
jgi:hypothetical protein